MLVSSTSDVHVNLMRLTITRVFNTFYEWFIFWRSIQLVSIIFGDFLSLEGSINIYHPISHGADHQQRGWFVACRAWRAFKKLNCLYIRLSKRMNVKASIKFSIFHLQINFGESKRHIGERRRHGKSDNWFIDRNHVLDFPFRCCCLTVARHIQFNSFDHRFNIFYFFSDACHY